MSNPTARKKSGPITGNLRPADPFELIRWLARSQNDPRKALAELVQNSLDAAASRVQIVRARERGMTALHILDDGTGVLPELTRQEALGYIATHIGHSRKRNLTPEQRRELMLQGKYGIGLLGFWSIGTHFEMRSQVNDSEPWVLRLTEDQSRFEIERVRGRLALRGTWTEVVIRQLHRPAFVALGARRITDYLAAELRGQLLAREVTITVHDRIARGRAPKLLTVQPVRYPGQPLPLPETVATPHGPLRVELYLLPEADAEHGRVTVSCAGTVVYDDLSEFELMDFRRSPWSDRRLTGMLDFSAFEVAPGSRRGVQPNEAAAAFAAAVEQIEQPIRELLAQEQQRMASELGADLLKQLQRAFRDVPRLAPEYDFFAVSGDAGRESRSDNDGVALADAAPVVAEPAAGETASDDTADIVEAAELFPPGPLASVEIVPATARVPLLGSKRLRARARAADGREIHDGVTFTWQCDTAGVTLATDAQRAEVHVSEPCEPGQQIMVSVVANEGPRSASAHAELRVVAELEGGANAQSGIPQPEFVNEPTANWRSRFRAGQWEVNAGHRDYQIACETSRRKLRYLAALLAKEIVLHSFPHPQHAAVLERLIEVLTITERRLER